jgi:hypothetical protein
VPFWVEGNDIHTSFFILGMSSRGTYALLCSEKEEPRDKYNPPLPDEWGYLGGNLAGGQSEMTSTPKALPPASSYDLARHWVTFADLPGRHLEQTLAMVRPVLDETLCFVERVPTRKLTADPRHQKAPYPLLQPHLAKKLAQRCIPRQATFALHQRPVDLGPVFFLSFWN